MNPIYSGAATLLAGAVAFSLLRFRASDITVETFLRETRPLSISGKDSLDKTCSGKNPTSGPKVQLSKHDVSSIFWNSRQFVCFANHARLCQQEDAELAAMFYIMQANHAKLRWQILLFIIETIAGKLGLGQITIYPRLLLWTYGEELDLLDKILEKRGPLEGHAIRAIL